MTVASPAFHATLDVRSIMPPHRFTQIFATFKTLAAGQTMELTVDHEPVALRDQFESLLTGKFSWEDLGHAAGSWRVAITRVACGGGCCGGCGGGA